MTILLPFLVMAVGYSISEYLPLQYRVAMVSGYRQYGAIFLFDKAKVLEQVIPRQSITSASIYDSDLYKK